MVSKWIFELLVMEDVATRGPTLHFVHENWIAA